MKISEMKRLLKMYGCYELAAGKEHDVWYSPITCAKIRIPRHQSKEVPMGTLNSILKQAGIQ
ncbi:MAG: type II toxin-antitoxin system HicA family toxin [Bacteroidales bacterium]|nr:type II toxin-antitoxin system HicA family toxin [Bacteroidales bacterium]